MKTFNVQVMVTEEEEISPVAKRVLLRLSNDLERFDNLQDAEKLMHAITKEWRALVNRDYLKG